MGRIAEVLSVERSGAGALVKVDPGGGANVSAEHFGDSGDDSLPLPGDFTALEESAGAGAEQVSGYHDSKNEGKAKPGEKRIYSRSTAGTPVAEIYLRDDGRIVIEVLKTGGASLLIKSAGTVVIDSPDIRIGNESASQPIARVGDLVAVTVPQLLSAAPGSPCVPVPPTAVTPTGGYVAAGQIISGKSGAKA
jgi:hypothetical protein